MLRVSPDFSKKLQVYLGKKVKLGHAWDRTKENFFEKINDKIRHDKLTISGLIDLLSQQNLNLTELFYKQLKGRADATSRAAQLIKQLFTELGGGELRSKALLNIIAGKDLEQIKLQMLQRLFENRKHNLLAFEHELLHLLSIQRREGESFVTAFYRSCGSDENLINKLVILQKNIPEYLPVLLNDLTSHYKSQPKFLETFVHTPISSGDPDPIAKKGIQELLRHVNWTISKAIFETYPDEFFKVPPELQPDLQQKLLHERPEIYENIKKKAIELKPRLDKLQALSAHFNDRWLKNNAGFINQQKAIHRIEKYLSTTSHSVKKAFFRDLINTIDKQGLTVDILQRELNATVNNPLYIELFKKWSGPMSSGAAHCIKDLYQLLTGEKLSYTQLKEMISSGKLPDAKQQESQQNKEKLSTMITEIIQNPNKYINNDLTRETSNSYDLDPVRKKIIKEYKKAKDVEIYTTFLQRDATYNQRKAEAIYQQALITKGLSEINNNSKLRIDPQGHVLLEIKLGDEEYKQIAQEVGLQTKEQLTGLLNLDPRKSTLCNLDIINIKGDTINRIFRDWLSDGKTIDDKLSSALDTFLKSPSRSSVIALQEEMEMYIRLRLRVIKKAFRNVTDEQWDAVFKEAAEEINKNVRRVFKNALLESFDNSYNLIDFKKLNKQLDASRMVLKSNSLIQLRMACNQKIDNFSNNYKAVKDKINLNTFLTTTATHLDCLRTDNRNHLVTRTTGTDITSHSNESVHGQAIRFIYRNNLVNCKVELSEQDNAEVRTPSLAKVKQTMGVKDVQIIFGTIYKSIQKRLGGYDGPMIYNLLTSHHSILYDKILDMGNHQVASAKLILKGAHVFNRAQVLENKPNSLWYVQNIAVNGFTHNLAYEGTSDAKTEATLMAEIALLFTFSQNTKYLSPILKTKADEAYAQVHSSYVSFLQNSKESDYFNYSNEGTQAQASIIQFKSELIKAIFNNNQLKPSDNPTPHELVSKILLKLFAYDDHWDKRFGMLVQSLSVFIEYASLAGCKSANERYLGVAGRVDLLDSIAFRKEEEEVFTQFKAFLDDPKMNPKQLQIVLDSAYNLHNLYGMATGFSLVDMGAPAKSNPARSNIFSRGYWDTNYFESKNLTFFSQKSASAMQPHKGDPVKELNDTMCDRDLKPKNAIPSLLFGFHR